MIRSQRPSRNPTPPESASQVENWVIGQWQRDKDRNTLNDRGWSLEEEDAVVRFAALGHQEDVLGEGGGGA